MKVIGFIVFLSLVSFSGLANENFRGIKCQTVQNSLFERVFALNLETKEIYLEPLDSNSERDILFDQETACGIKLPSHIQCRHQFESLSEGDTLRIKAAFKCNRGSKSPGMKTVGRLSIDAGITPSGVVDGSFGCIFSRSEELWLSSCQVFE